MASLTFLIHTGDPSCSPVTSPGRKDKNIVRSTAARQAHARRRRDRTAQYQANKAATQDATVRQCSDPRTVLAASRLDPFSSFAMELTARDKFLFDHCQLSGPRPNLEGTILADLMTLDG